MNTRPITSKPRGLCRYYDQPRGCFAGKRCKFLHGESERLTMYDKSKICKFFNSGYCKRGEGCWFIHAAPSQVEQRPSDEHVCCICLEKPTTYGLLSGCSHVFCVNCIRQWRDPVGKTGDVVTSRVTKKCPLCRSESRFVTPSSVFFEQGDAGKGETIERYKKSMGKVSCSYFQISNPTARACPFGADCFYQHVNDDGTPHMFKEGVERCMKKCRRANQDTRYAFMGYDPLDIAVLNTMDFNAVLMENWDAMVEEAEDDDDGAAEEDVWSATDAGPSTIPWPSTEQEEAPFVTDGRGRVVGSTCITI